MFDYDQDVIKVNILSKFEEDWVKMVASKSVNKIFLRFDLVTYFLNPSLP
jgi:hypothetical protein